MYHAPRADERSCRESSGGVSGQLACSASAGLQLTDQTTEGIENCLADPKRLTCISKSYPTSTEFEIELERLPAEAMSKIVFVQFTGPRADHRSRSASPTYGTNRSVSHGDEQEPVFDARQLPHYVTLWATPHRRLDDRVEWLSHVINGDQPRPNMSRTAEYETGQQPVFISRVELGRRVTQREVPLYRKLETVRH
jgi:hypothetical protein